MLFVTPTIVQNNKLQLTVLVERVLQRPELARLAWASLGS